jgi:hypothetical protein
MGNYHPRFRGDELQEIVRLFEAGETKAELIRRFHASRASIQTALRHQVSPRQGRRPWRHFTPDEIERMLALWADGRSQTYIGLAFNASQGVISRVLREHEIEPIARRYSSRRLEASNLWKGGRILASGGYIAVKLPRSDPLATMCDRAGYVREHRLVMARSLGRPLRRDETIHHINGIRDDNRRENLQLRQGQHGHHVAMVCRDCGSHNVGPLPLL